MKLISSLSETESFEFSFIFVGEASEFQGSPGAISKVTRGSEGPSSYLWPQGRVWNEGWTKILSRGWGAWHGATIGEI